MLVNVTILYWGEGNSPTNPPHRPHCSFGFPPRANMTERTSHQHIIIDACQVFNELDSFVQCTLLNVKTTCNFLTDFYKKHDVDAWVFVLAGHVQSMWWAGSGPPGLSLISVINFGVKCILTKYTKIQILIEAGNVLVHSWIKHLLWILHFSLLEKSKLGKKYGNPEQLDICPIKIWAKFKLRSPANAMVHLELIVKFQSKAEYC